MSGIDDYLAEVEQRLHVRGRDRRRLLHECRDHLDEAASVVGVADAVRRFGPAGDLAASYDVAVAAGRARHATAASTVGVVAIGASTLALLNAADPHSSAVPVWAVLFFTCAQAAAAMLALALLQLVVTRHRDPDPADIRLLGRRNGLALAFSAVTLFAAGAAVPGHGSAFVILSGPALAVVAAAGVLRAHLLTRRLVSRRPATRLWPAAISLPRNAISLSIVLTVVGAVGAYGWDHSDQGTFASSLTAAVIEALLIIVGLVALGPARHLRPHARTG